MSTNQNTSAAISRNAFWVEFGKSTWILMKKLPRRLLEGIYNIKQNTFWGDFWHKIRIRYSQRLRSGGDSEQSLTTILTTWLSRFKLNTRGYLLRSIFSNGLYLYDSLFPHSVWNGMECRFLSLFLPYCGG